MRVRTVVILVMTAIAVTAVLTSFLSQRLTAQTVYPPAMQIEKLRFRLVGDEPVAVPGGAASPTGLGLAAGWKAQVLKDMVVGNCYFAFLNGTAMSIVGPGVCP